MIEVKTSELEGAALDWAVAYPLNGERVFFKAFGARVLGRRITTEVGNGNISPSTKWAQCGPLIAEYSISLHCPQSTDDVWAAWRITPSGEFCCGGETPIIAACRAIVAAHSGDVVSVPAELINQ
ncbi:MAG: DUF2591 domain-containing protein [Microbacterium sp.]|uniref:phage protein NinX family protein n=1 Tax=Microbacterium sp. TaxID=51671 RepID=UPI00261B098C|nr:phage protein NinX family protein [Microbacterium sp.]MCV0420103.1 DUF2591 domain-containing protein [Microbacterium sp.]